MANFNLNKVMLGGRLTAAPELKQTQSGISVCSFSMAVNRYAKPGEAQQADFFNVTAWRQTAEFVHKFFGKGSSIFVIGQMRNNSWTDPHGVKHYGVDIVAEDVRFVDSRNDTPADASGQDASTYVPDSYAAPVSAPDFTEVGKDEDVPF